MFVISSCTKEDIILMVANAWFTKLNPTYTAHHINLKAKLYRYLVAYDFPVLYLHGQKAHLHFFIICNQPGG